MRKRAYEQRVWRGTAAPPPSGLGHLVGELDRLIFFFFFLFLFLTLTPLLFFTPNFFITHSFLSCLVLNLNLLIKKKLKN